MDRISVSVFIKSLGLGGAERLIIDSLPYLDREHFDYHFAYMTPWKNTLAPAVRDAGFDVTCLGIDRQQIYYAGDSSHSGYVQARSLQSIALAPTAYVKLSRQLRQDGIDVLQADLPFSGVLARLAAKRTSVPIVYTEHNLQERYHPATRWLNKATYGMNDVVFAVSNEVAESIRSNGMSTNTRVVVLPNGVPIESIQRDAADISDLRRELDFSADGPVVGAVAVMRTQKRLADWLAVANNVAAAHPDVRFLLVGDGPEMPHVRQWIAANGLQERVRLTGFREDGRRLLALCDIYLITSGFEGLPLSMLEAMALGKPVVATAVGGIPEVIRSGENGMLASIGDIQQLAAQVNALLINEKAAHQLGNEARNTVEAHFHTRDRVGVMEEVYRQLAGRGDGNHAV